MFISKNGKRQFCKTSCNKRGKKTLHLWTDIDTQQLQPNVLMDYQKTMSKTINNLITHIVQRTQINTVFSYYIHKNLRKGNVKHCFHCEKYLE